MNEVGRLRRQSLVSALRPAILDRHVLAVYVAGLLDSCSAANFLLDHLVGCSFLAAASYSTGTNRDGSERCVGAALAPSSLCDDHHKKALFSTELRKKMTAPTKT